MMGSSDPTGKSTLTKEKILVNNIIDKPKDGFVKYGVVELDKNGTVKVPLGDYEDEKELKDNVKKIPFKERKSLDEGIKSAGKEFDKNGRPKARKIMVVFIDGNDDSTKDQLDKVAKPLKKKNVKIIPVVLGENVDEEKLKPWLGKKKKPKKEKDPVKLAEEVAEEIFNGRNSCHYEIHFPKTILQKYIVLLSDPCFAAECKDCAAKPDDSTTCGGCIFVFYVVFELLTKILTTIWVFFFRSW